MVANLSLSSNSYILNTTQPSTLVAAADPLSSYNYDVIVVCSTQLAYMALAAPVYAFSMFVIARDQSMFRKPCFKLMFQLGMLELYAFFGQTFFYNLCALCGNNFGFNVQKFVNATFVGVWNAIHATAALLSVNRCMTVLNGALERVMFARNVLWIWLVAIGLWAGVGFVYMCTPGNDDIFNVFKHAQVVKPVFPELWNSFKYVKLAFGAVMLVSYLLMLAYFRRLRSVILNAPTSAETYSAFVPPFLACFMLLTMDFFVLFFAGSFSSITLDFLGCFTLGFNGIFYLLFNSNVRRKAANLLWLGSGSGTVFVQRNQVAPLRNYNKINNNTPPAGKSDGSSNKQTTA